MNILVSVYDKDGLLGFLEAIGWKNHTIYASGGTYSYLIKNGIESINSSEITGFGELFDGRVKTLHPGIFSGILSRDINSDQ
ncbi:MGS-like domain protein, partial [mine drainage metagenome]